MKCKACCREDCVCEDTWEPVNIDLPEKEPRELARDDFCEVWGEEFGSIELCRLAFTHAIQCWHEHIPPVSNTQMDQLRAQERESEPRS